MTLRRTHDGRGWTTVLRIVAFVVSVVLIVVVVVTIVRNLPRSAACPSRPLTEVRGLIGSEKEAFFDDKRVQAQFACAGLAVTVDPVGSREMPAALNRGGYGFAFPGSTPTAEKIMRDRGITERYTLFSSPMAVATFRSIVDVLARVGIVRVASDGTQVVDIAGLIDAARKGTRWDQLRPGAARRPGAGAARRRARLPP